LTSVFYSQFGEDRILSGIFRDKPLGVCIEVGANDGVHGSNTLYFEKIGWQCILVEPNPSLCAEIRAVRSATLFECAASNRRGTVTLHVVEGAWRADGMSTTSDKPEDHERIAAQGFRSRPIQVPAVTLDDILSEARMGAAIDFISIDVEGLEVEVLEGLSLPRWQPTILILEDNSNATSAVVPDYLAGFGYVRFLRTGVNDWYAQRTDKRLVNAASRLRMAATLLVLRTKSVLKRIPLAVKVRNALRPRGPAP
jgi:FkbM family methyltransferase